MFRTTDGYRPVVDISCRARICRRYPPSAEFAASVTVSVPSSTHVPAAHDFSALGLTCCAFRLSRIVAMSSFPTRAIGARNSRFNKYLYGKAMLVGTKISLPLTVPSARKVTCDSSVAAQSKARLRYHRWTT